jgi:hypothetical protein
MSVKLATSNPTSPVASRSPEPERAALAAAIAAAAKTEMALQKARAAVDRGSRLVADAEAKRQAAIDRVARAKQHEARRIAAAIGSGRQVEVEGGLRAARAAEVEAGDGADAAHLAAKQLSEMLPELETAHRLSLNAIEVEINKIMAQECRRVIDEARTLRSKLLATWSVLSVLSVSSDQGFQRPDGGSSIEAMTFLDQLQKPMRGLLESVAEVTETIFFDAIVAAQASAAGPYRAWREELHTNPEAVLAQTDQA